MNLTTGQQNAAVALAQAQGQANGKVWPDMNTEIHSNGIAEIAGLTLNPSQKRAVLNAFEAFKLTGNITTYKAALAAA